MTASDFSDQEYTEPKENGWNETLEENGDE